MAPIAATETLVHGTAIAIGGRAALLRAASGRGKSDLALRALGTPVGPLFKDPFELVADDQVVVRTSAEGLMLAPHPRLAGLIEVRGIGIVRLPHRTEARLALLVDLVEPAVVDRMPGPWPMESLMGVRLPVLRLAPFEASAPLKLALALTVQPWRSKDT